MHNTGGSGSLFRKGRSLMADMLEEELSAGPQLPPGPDTIGDMFDFASQFMGRISEHRDGRRMMDRMLASFAGGVLVMTDYSGMGGCEMGFRMIQSAIESLGRQSRVRFYRSSDILKHARLVLMTDDPGGSPEHVFGNILGRLPTCVALELEKLMEQMQAQFNRRIADGEDAVVVAKQLGSEFMGAAHSIMQQVRFSADARQWCYKHRRFCNLYPQDIGAWPLSLACAGTTCTSWSSMGQKKHWMTKSAVVFLAWAYEMLAFRPAIIVHECTPEFDFQQLIIIFGSFYLIRSCIFSPTDLGLPMSRPRRYTIMMLRCTFQPLLSFDVDGFGSLFFRSLRLTGHVLWQAPQQMVNAHISKLAEKAFLPSLQADGSPWPIRVVLSQAVDHRIECYEKMCRRARRRMKYIVNLRQTPQWCNGWSEAVPTLLTSTSYLWSMVEGRVLLPIEHLGVQGLDCFNNCPSLPECPVVRLALSGALTPREVMHLAGNSFNIAAVTSVLLFAFTCFENRKAPAPAPVSSLRAPLCICDEESDTDLQ